MAGNSSHNFLSELTTQICTARRETQRALFLVGSGVSKPSGIPDMACMLNQMKVELDSFVTALPDNSDPKDLGKGLVEQFEILLKSDMPTASRKIDPVLANRVLVRFQNAPALREAWGSFCTWMLEKSVKDGPLYDAKPNEAHRSLAKFIKEYEALVLSVNFDGLIRKAFEEEYKGNRTLILDEPKQIRHYFSRRETVKLPAYVKLRGDAFLATCRTRGCRLHDTRVPIYRGPHEGGQSRTCPECGQPRTLNISFPGLQEKDQEIRDVLASMWEYAACSVKVVILVGISCEWDPILEAFVRQLVVERGIRLFYISPNGSQKDEVFKDLSRAQSGDVAALQYIDGGADELLPVLVEKLQNSVRSRIATNRIEKYDSFKDGYWDQTRKGRSPITIRATDLEHRVCAAVQDYQYLKASQLGLKGYWLGDIGAEQHNRLYHSRGTAVIADHMLVALYRNSGLKSGTPDSREHTLVRVAALLHDVGHKYFSHLLEEIYRELGWLGASGVSHLSHSDLTQQSVSKILKPFQTDLRNQEVEIDDVARLINGALGVPYLDAILNSSFDADKIDYIFRDSDHLETSLQYKGLRASLLPEDWFEKLKSSEGISISPSGFLVLSGEAAKSALQLLEVRQSLYEGFYLAQFVRYPEALTKWVLRLFIIKTLGKNFQPSQDKIKVKSLEEARLALLDDAFEEIVSRTAGAGTRNDPPEVYILGEAFDDLLGDESIEEEIQKALRACRSWLLPGNELPREPGDRVRHYLRLEEEQRVVPPVAINLDRENRESQEKIDRLAQLADRTMLTHPGHILIDIARPVNFFATADSCKPQKRADGTEAGRTTVLVPKDIFSAKFSEEELVPIERAGFEVARSRPITVYCYTFSEDTRSEATFLAKDFLATAQREGILNRRQ